MCWPSLGSGCCRACELRAVHHACRNGDLGGLNFVEIKAFGEEAIVANDRLTEGIQVDVRGYIRTESWTPQGRGWFPAPHLYVVRRD